MTNPIASLQKNVCQYKEHLAKIRALQAETLGCFQELQEMLDLKDDQRSALLPALQVPQCDFSNHLPCVMFIGNQNCGKSTLLNTLLGKKHLPTHENPCTSRIVRTVYSEEGNCAKLVDEKGNVLKEQKFKTCVPGELVVLEDNEKDDDAKLKAIVEVGLQHDLLKSGIELIDSPGRCESEALDRVVKGFLEKKIVPLIVYVVDGNQHILQKDKETLRELQDNFPNVSLMFVCSKVDISKQAVDFDRDDDDEDGEDISDKEIANKAQEKKIAVFNQLKSLGFLPQDADIDTCPVFHGVSANLVKKARRRHQVNDATESFDRFQLCIMGRLDNALKKQCQRGLASLLSAQEMILSSAVNTRNALTFTAEVLPHVCDQALKTELSIFETVIRLCVRCDDITNAIRKNMEDLSMQFLLEGENYQTTDRKTLRHEFETIQLEAGLDLSVLRKIKVEELLIMDFLGDIKGAILDKTFNVMKVSLHEATRESLSKAIGEVIKLSQTISHPFIGRILQRIYEMEYRQAHPSQQEQQEQETSFQNLHVILDGLLESVNAALNYTLRKEISQPLSEFDLNEVGKNQRPRDPMWRRKVVQTLLSKLDYRKIATSVTKTCEDTLLSMHNLFRNTVQNFRVLNEALHSGNVPMAIANLRRNYVPRVAELAVRGHALRYLIDRGPSELGERISNTAHAQLFVCSSPSWCIGRQQCVVKVVARARVSKEVWKQTMLDNMHTKDIFESLGCCPPNHLRLHGWLMPDPDVIFIVMEKVESDLLVALQGGMTWPQRMKVAMDTAKGVEAIHRANYVYQDLKPQNVMLSADGTAKINLCKPEKPFEMTKLGLPFHISPTMCRNYKQAQSEASYDVYALGSLLWVLCEGSGEKCPQAYEHCLDIEAMKRAAMDGVRPERPAIATDACWDLMNKCWTETVDILYVLRQLNEM